MQLAIKTETNYSVKTMHYKCCDIFIYIVRQSWLRNWVFSQGIQTYWMDPKTWVPLLSNGVHIPGEIWKYKRLPKWCSPAPTRKSDIRHRSGMVGIAILRIPAATKLDPTLCAIRSPTGSEPPTSLVNVAQVILIFPCWRIIYSAEPSQGEEVPSSIRKYTRSKATILLPNSSASLPSVPSARTSCGVSENKAINVKLVRLLYIKNVTISCLQNAQGRGESQKVQYTSGKDSKSTFHIASKRTTLCLLHSVITVALCCTGCSDRDWNVMTVT